jgi:hypothetical protein
MTEYLAGLFVRARMRILFAAIFFFVSALLAPTGADAQPRWQRAGHGWFTIVTPGGTCLDVHGEDVGRDGARVHFWRCHGGRNQLWRFEDGRIVSVVGGCLDVHGGDVGRDGARIQTWSCHDGPNQQWIARPDGSFESASGGCLDVEGGAISNDGTRAIAWSCHGGTNQRFDVLAQGPSRPSRPSNPSYQVMDDASFAALVARVQGAPFSSDRIAAVGGAASAWFTSAQIAALVQAMTFSEERLQVVELLAPHLIDRHNGGAIADVMTFSSERDRTYEILARFASR